MSVITNLRKEIKFKFKSLRVYGSDEWMAAATKKYRTVFDKSELKYVRCELALYNLEMEQSAWRTEVVFKCFETSNGLRKELCSLDNTITVEPNLDILYVRDGWGAPDSGTFWTHGNYTWEVYVDGIQVGSASFVVNEIGLVTRTENPYFSVREIKFYGGGYEGWKQETRNYLDTFSRSGTQYVWAEVVLTCKTDVGWNYELFFNYLDSARQLKGQIIKNGRVDHDHRGHHYTFDIGWGNETPGSWKAELYHFDVVFMDNLIATSSFFIGDTDKPGIPAPVLMTK